MGEDLRKLAVIMIPVVFLMMSIPAVAPESSGHAANASGGYVTANSVQINRSEILHSNLTAYNLTIGNGVVLNTNGYNIIVNNTFTNHGTILTGSSPAINFTKSFGGSGGGAWAPYSQEEIGKTGYATKSPGGYGSDVQFKGGSGGTPTPIDLSTQKIQAWYSEGFSQFLSGAAGQAITGGPSGLGANGIYIQAGYIENLGTISARGGVGYSEGGSMGSSGGGGGGVILLAYGHAFTRGIIDISGGSGVLSGPSANYSGNGGAGQMFTYNFGSSYPVKPPDLKTVPRPEWASVGVFANYSLAQYSSSYVSDTFQPSWENFTIVSVNLGFGDYEYRVELGHPNSVRGAAGQQFNNSSLVLPEAGPFFVGPQLSAMVNGSAPVPTPLSIFRETPKVTTVNIKIAGVTVRAYKVQEYVLTNHVNDTFTVWIGQKSGILLKENYSQINTQTSATLSAVTTLTSSNIVKNDVSSGTLLYYIIGVIAVVVALLSFMMMRRSRGESPNTRARMQPSRTEQGTVAGKAAESRVVQARLEELKSMLDHGIITQEYYDETVRNLKGLK